jgi:hypothetical protein
MELITYTLKYKIKKIITNSHSRIKKTTTTKLHLNIHIFFDIKEICTK